MIHAKHVSKLSLGVLDGVRVVVWYLAYRTVYIYLTDEICAGMAVKEMRVAVLKGMPPQNIVHGRRLSLQQVRFCRSCYKEKPGEYKGGVNINERV